MSAIRPDGTRTVWLERRGKGDTPMMKIKRTGTLVMVVFAAWLALGGVRLMAHGEDAGSTAAQLPLSVDITTEVQPEEPNGIIGILIAVRHNGQGPAAQVRVTAPHFDGILLLRSRVLTERSTGARPMRVVQRAGQVMWQGTIDTSGVLVIGVGGRTAMCVGDDRTGTVVVEVTDRDGSNQFTTQEPFTIPCVPAVDPSGVSVEKFLLLPAIQAAREAAISGESVTLRIDLTNNLSHDIHALITDEMAPAGDTLAQNEDEECSWRMDSIRTSGGRDILMPSEALGDDAYVGVLAPRIKAGATRSILVSGTALGGSLDCVLHGAARVYAVTAGVGDGILDRSSKTGAGSGQVSAWRPGPSDIDFLRNLKISAQQSYTLPVTLPDLGDAPDSTNHFGMDVEAYPGVRGRFPTIADPTTGSAPGPLHSNAGSLTLGTMVSAESDAYSGADANIDPTAGQPGLDAHDDGVSPKGISFVRCQSTVIPVMFTIGPRALRYFADCSALAAGDCTAYVNVWVDANRDGDWDDAIDCSDGVGPALEHIVRNHPVDVMALGDL